MNPLDELAEYLRRERYDSSAKLSADMTRWLTALEQVRADARRYQWLREDRESDGPCVQSTEVGCIGVRLTGDSLDAAIDALARKEVE